MPSVWGIHDFVPDFQGFSSLEDYMARKDEVKNMTGSPTGCGYLRVIMPLDAIGRQDGWCTGYAAGRPPPEAGGYRVVMAQRMDKHGALPEWRRMRARHRLVYELDDDVWSVDRVNWQAYGFYSRRDTLDAVMHAAQVADSIITSTGPLAEVVRRETGRTDITVVPNVVHDELLTMQRPRHHRKCVVGWSGGMSHAADISMIAEPLRDVLTAHRKRAELHIIGTDFRKTIGKIPARWTDWIPVDATLRYYQVIDFDVALAPLTGTTFDVSKSAVKAIEAFALGIPVIASDVEPYREVVTDGVTGYLCRTPAQFGRRLRDLINDQAMREEMGAKAREVARSHTIGEHWRRWAAVFAALH